MSKMKKGRTEESAAGAKRRAKVITWDDKIPSLPFVAHERNVMTGNNTLKIPFVLVQDAARMGTQARLYSPRSINRIPSQESIEYRDSVYAVVKKMFAGLSK